LCPERRTSGPGTALRSPCVHRLIHRCGELTPFKHAEAPPQLMPGETAEPRSSEQKAVRGSRAERVGRRSEGCRRIASPLAPPQGSRGTLWKTPDASLVRLRNVRPGRAERHGAMVQHDPDKLPRPWPATGCSRSAGQAPRFDARHRAPGRSGERWRPVPIAARSKLRSCPAFSSLTFLILWISGSSCG